MGIILCVNEEIIYGLSIRTARQQAFHFMTSLVQDFCDKSCAKPVTHRRNLLICNRGIIQRMKNSQKAVPAGRQGFALLLLLVLIAALLIGGGAYVYEKNKQANQPVMQGTNSISYTNSQYGFSFLLPNSWKGFSIVTSEWGGYTNGPQGDVVAATGPMISIRHPEWTEQTPRQDIPIMIFTIQQWNDLQQGKFHIDAAPIGPSELGRNAKYVFALPARYNYAFPTGYEEVQTILAGNPLRAF